MQIIDAFKYWKDAPTDWPVYSKSMRYWTSEGYKKTYTSLPEWISVPPADTKFALRLGTAYFFYNLGVSSLHIFTLETGFMNIDEKIEVFNNIGEAKTFSEIDALNPVASPKVEIWAWKVDKKGVSHECV